MLIALAAPALLFIIGLGIMIRNEDKCMRRNECAAFFSRKPR